MIFLGTDHDWILAHNHRELVDAPTEHVDPDDDDHLLRLAAACLECEEEEVMWIDDNEAN